MNRYLTDELSRDYATGRQMLFLSGPRQVGKTNVVRALRKEPKYYLWDWSQVDDAGARAENLVASALLKATHWWTMPARGQRTWWPARC